MRSFRRIMFILGGSLLVLGVILATTGYFLGGDGRFSITSKGIVTGNQVIHINKDGKIVKDSYALVKQDKVALGDIKEVNINTAYADIEVIDSDAFYIEYTYLGNKNEPCHKVKDGVLTYEEPNVINTISIGSFFHSEDNDYYIKLYIPKNASFDSFHIDSSSGDVKLKDFNTKIFNLNASYGDVKIDNVTTKESNIELSSGNSQISNFNTENLQYANSYGDAIFSSINTGATLKNNNNSQMSLDLSSGDIKINDCIISKLDLENSYGNINLTNVNTKNLEGELSSGTITAKECDLGNVSLENSYGDVNLDFLKTISSYDYDIKCDYGDIKINDSSYEDNVTSSSNHEYKINIEVSSGDVDLNFAK